MKDNAALQSSPPVLLFVSLATKTSDRCTSVVSEKVFHRSHSFLEHPLLQDVDLIEDEDDGRF